MSEKWEGAIYNAKHQWADANSGTYTSYLTWEVRFQRLEGMKGWELHMERANCLQLCMDYGGRVWQCWQCHEGPVSDPGERGAITQPPPSDTQLSPAQLPSWPDTPQDNQHDRIPPKHIFLNRPAGSVSANYEAHILIISTQLPLQSKVINEIPRAMSTTYVSLTTIHNE